MSLIPSGTTVTVETKYFPPLTVDLTPAPVGAKPGIGGFITRRLKPRVTVSLHGTTLVRVAPYGDPEPNEWNKVRIGLAVVAALAAFSILRILK